MRWKKFKIGDLCHIRRGSSPRPINNFISNSGLPWVKISDATSINSRFIEKTKEFIKEEGKEKTVVVKPGTLILSNSATPGLPKFLNITAGVHDGWLILTDFSNVLKEYLYYVLLKERRRLLLGANGSVFNNLKTDTVRDFEILIPESLKEQEKIISILSTLDNKIELNNQMNQGLEEIAMTLYKHWFVDFGPFQDCEFVESELGMIPKGWEVRKVLDLGEIITGKTPSTKKKEYYGNDVPFIKIPDMHNQVYTTETETMLSTTGADTQKKKYLPENSVCVSCIATPGLVCLTDRLSQTNQQINSVICKDGISSYFTYLFFRNISSNIISLGSGGTATLNLNKKDFSNIKLVVPDKETMSKFNEKVQSLFDFIRVNQNEVESLTQARDYLLPKLLSGEIDLSEAEETVENAVQ